MACHEQGDYESGAPDFLSQLLVNADLPLQLIEQSGASVTNKGIYYESGKEPPSEGPPKLHLLIESNDEYRVSAKICLMSLCFLLPFTAQVEHAVREIKRLLLEASAAAIQAESRGPQAVGRYSVL